MFRLLAAALQSDTQVAVPFIFLCGYCVSVGGGAKVSRDVEKVGRVQWQTARVVRGPCSYQERLQGLL